MFQLVVSRICLILISLYVGLTCLSAWGGVNWFFFREPDFFKSLSYLYTPTRGLSLYTIGGAGPGLQLAGQLLLAACFLATAASAFIGSSKLHPIWLGVPFGVAVVGLLNFIYHQQFGRISFTAASLSYSGGCIPLCIVAGFFLGRLWRAKIEPWFTNIVVQRAEKRSALPKSRRTVDLGFTLIELIVVIAIICVLTAILMPVLAQSKLEARHTEDREKLRQTYVAITLYENDHDTKSPRSLVQIVPAYAPKQILWSILDTRNGRERTKWPANIWVNDPVADAPEDMWAMSPFMISFAYLRPFEGRFQKGVTFEELRNNPQVGLVTNVAFGGCVGGCHEDDRSFIPPDQPMWPSPGMIVVRTDGSITTRRNCGAGTFSYEQMFLFWPLGGCQ